MDAVRFSVMLPRFTAAVTAQCPCDQVYGSKPEDATFVPSVTATQTQVTNATTVVSSFDWSEAAQSAWEDTKAGRDVPQAIKNLRQALQNATPLTDQQIKAIFLFLLSRLFPKSA